MIYAPSDWLFNGENPLDTEIKRKRIWLRLPRTQRIRRKCAQAWCRYHAGSYSKVIRSFINFAIARNYKPREFTNE